MGFTPHCNFNIELQDKIMICTMSGVWNLEGVSKYFQEIKQQVSSITLHKWVRIADISDFEGGSMELMVKLIEIHNWTLRHNCVGLILVNPRPLNKTILENNADKYTDVSYSQSLEEAIIQAKLILQS